MPSVRLAIMARPRAGDWLDDEIAGWRAEGINVIVSLLEAEEVEDLGLHREPRLCNDFDMEFYFFSLPGPWCAGVKRKAMALAETIVARLTEGKAVALRCRARIGRSSLMAACALALLGLAPESASDLIGKARGLKVFDTERQRDWVHMFAKREVGTFIRSEPRL